MKSPLEKLKEEIQENKASIEIFEQEIATRNSKKEGMRENKERFVKELQEKEAELKELVMNMSEKELEIELKNYELLIKYKFDLQCETIFSKTQTFEKDAILNFIQSLCQVSTRELEDYATPRVYSLRKLIEVCDFNIDRIQMEWAIMWKLISEYLEFTVLVTLLILFCISLEDFITKHSRCHSTASGIKPL